MTCIKGLDFKRLFIVSTSVLLVSACVTTTSEHEENAFSATQNNEVQASAQETAVASAQNHYLAAKRTFSSEQQSVFNSAIALTKSGDFEQASQVLQGITVTDETPSAYWVLTGDIAKALGDTQLAQSAYEIAVEHNQYNHFALNRLGALAREQGDFKRANHYWNEALAAWPNNPLVHLNMGILHDLYLGDKVTALRHYHQYQTIAQAPSAHSDQQTLKSVQRWIKDVERQIAMQQQEGVTSGN